MQQPLVEKKGTTGKLGALGLIVPVIVATGLVAASLPSSSTVAVQKKLWCISNYIEAVPYEVTPQGKPRQEHLLDDRLPWLRRDQIEAQTREEAQKIFMIRFGSFFSASNREELVDALQKGDEAFFTHHYNTGAIAEGPCEGTGELGVDDGKWFADAQIEECGGDTGTKGPTTSNYKPIGKEFEVNITFYSPCTAGNECDCKSGGGMGSWDGGFFVTTDGKIKWRKGNKVLDHVFAQPQSDNIINKKFINRYAVLIEGFSIGAVEIHDHYGKGVHDGQSYLDLSYTCGEGGKLQKELAAIQKRQGVSPKGSQGTTVKARIVDLDATRAQSDQNVIEVALNKISGYLKPNDSQTILADTSSGSDSTCPAKHPVPGPSFGTDYHNDITYSNQSGNSEFDSTAPLSANPTGNIVSDIARGQVGYQGQGPCAGGRLDRTKYNGNTCSQWCAYFATWVLKQASYNIPKIGSSRDTLQWFKSNGHQTFTDPKSAQAGDIVVWKRPNDEQGHIGIVTGNNGSKITVVEGNTSHDQVKEYSYSYDRIINNHAGLLGFGRW